MKNIYYYVKKNYFIILCLLPAIIIYTVFLVIPVLNSINLSFHTGPGIIPREWAGLQNYIDLFTKNPYKERFFNAILNNIKFFLIVSILQNFGGFIIAYIVTRKFHGAKLFRIITFLPVTISVLVVGFLFSLILNPVWGAVDKILKSIGLGFIIKTWLGNPNTALPIIALVTVWQNIGMAILFFTAAIDNIDEEIIESARIDGASQFQIAKNITFPLILPIFGVIYVLTFIGNFTAFDIVYAMVGTYAPPFYSTDILGTLFYRTAFGSADRGGWGMGMGSAIATIMFIIVFIGAMLWIFVFRRKNHD